MDYDLDDWNQATTSASLPPQLVQRQPIITDLRHLIRAAVNDVFGIARDGLTPGEWDGQLRRAAPPTCTDVVMFHGALQEVMDRCCDEPVSAETS